MVIWWFFSADNVYFAIFADTEETKNNEYLYIFKLLVETNLVWLKKDGQALSCAHNGKQLERKQRTPYIYTLRNTGCFKAKF